MPRFRVVRSRAYPEDAITAPGRGPCRIPGAAGIEKAHTEVVARALEISGPVRYAGSDGAARTHFAGPGGTGWAGWGFESHSSHSAR
ncbi:hypothetical protein ROS62_00075 [Streptomyces sp. DSM 41972]|uniref:Uncharacterized protein n=1 Tax=Streptomyces althioticus subsp. attaecolombicae TaxID=3075534 RepID=A0ABU3HRN6_9ACTN|nr:hypothetical protein [Streptomyces sp. DSM 41972]SCD32875.1 hypothetical protein GA0115245_103116 [Streptomyces sp. di188]SCD44230.1 hypothetical protein GA0115238_109114 [Streptomyces sp. di50b]